MIRNRIDMFIFLNLLIIFCIIQTRRTDGCSVICKRASCHPLDVVIDTSLQRCWTCIDRSTLCTCQNADDLMNSTKVFRHLSMTGSELYLYVDGSCLTECPRHLVQHKAVCLEKCPPDTVQSGGFCVNRTQNNEFMTKIKHSNICPTGFMLQNGSCVNSCPTSQPYIDRSSNTCLSLCPLNFFQSGHYCLPCDDTCHGCVGPSSEDCKTCLFASVRIEKYSKCVKSCPIEAPYLNRTNGTAQCVDHCDTFSVIDGIKECLTRCPDDNFYSVNGECTHSCPAQLPYKQNVGITIRCFANCPPDYFHIPGATDCFVNCTEPFSYAWKVYCLDACPPHARFVLRNSRMCTDSCTGQSDCELYCPQDKNHTLNGTCLLTCPEGYQYTVNGDRECYAACPKGTWHLRNSIECRASCPEEFPLKNVKECVRECSPDIPFVQGEMCYTFCPKDMVHVAGNFTCIGSCPDYLPFVFNKTCFQQCPSYVPLEYNKNCYDFCPKWTYNYKNSTCVSFCPDDMPRYYDGRCVKRCPPSHPYKPPNRWDSQGRNCVSDCPQDQIKIVNGEYNCRSSCPDDYRYLFNKTCWKNCPDNAPYHKEYDYTCFSICPEGLYLIPDKGTCESYCPNGMLKLLMNSTCVKECPHQMFRHQMECVNECPNGTTTEYQSCSVCDKDCQGMRDLFLIYLLIFFTLLLSFMLCCIGCLKHHISRNNKANIIMKLYTDVDLLEDITEAYRRNQDLNT